MSGIPYAVSTDKSWPSFESQQTDEDGQRRDDVAKVLGRRFETCTAHQ
jgi:hypothetical protein